jgi:RNA polymerase primary sigma factor
MFLMKIGKIRLLSAAEEIAYAEQAKAGNIIARNKMITANLKLVFSIAKRFTWSRIPLGDLIQDGGLGLIEAIKGFEPERGCRFSTYATYWIRQAIHLSIAKMGRTIRLPVTKIEKIYELHKVINELQQQLGRNPTEKETTEASGMPADKVRMLLKSSEFPLSLEMPSGEEGDEHLGNFLADPSSKPPEEEVLRSLLLKKVISTLNHKESAIIRLRFGIDDGCPRTLAEVGRMFKVTRERIRQIEAKAISRLRHPTRSLKLKEYL